MKLDQTPPEARINVPTEDLSSVAFTSNLLEFIMAAAGSTTIRAGKIRDTYYVHVGVMKFQGASTEEVYRALFYWLLTKDMNRSLEEYANLANTVLEEPIDMEIIDIIAGEGMTDQGKVLEAYRAEISAAIVQALTKLSAEPGGLPRNTELLVSAVKTLAKRDDIELRDVLVVLGDMKSLEPQLKI